MGGAPVAVAGIDGAERARVRRRRVAMLLAFGAVPLCLRLWAIDHGDGGSYVPDAHVVRQALGMARDRDLVPPVGKYSTYPNLIPYLLLPIYLAQYLLGLVSGAWSDASGYAEAAAKDPALVAVPARVLVALVSAGSGWVAFRAARAAGLGAGAWIAGWLAGTSLLAVHYATHERPWAFVAFFALLASWAAIEHARGGGWKALCWCGAAAGAAFASHQAGLGVLLAPFGAWLLSPRPWRGALAARVVEGCAAVLCFALVGVVVGHPYLLVHGSTPQDAVVGGAQLAQLDAVSVGGMPVVFGVRWESAARLGHAALGYDPVLVSLLVPGLLCAFFVRNLRGVALFVLGWLCFFLVNQSDHVRYLLPGLAAGCLPAAACAEALWRRPWARGVLVVLLCAPLVQAARFACILGREDTRVEGARVAATGEGLLLVDRYGPELPLDRESLLLLRDLRRSRGEDLRLREAARLARLESGAESGGVRAVRIEELLDGDERSGAISVKRGLESRGATPEQLLRAIGARRVLEVRREADLPGGRDEGHLYAHLWRDGREVARVDPARAGVEPREMRLPTEMEFPLVALWQVWRPGPRLRLVEMP